MERIARRYAIAMIRLFRFGASCLLCLLAQPAFAEDEDDGPYWASISVDEVNMRVGPAGTYKIEWVYVREGLPVKVLRREAGWRLIEDPDGAQGWMLGRFLSRERTAIVAGEELAEVRGEASASAPLLWRLEPGVIAGLRECSDGWCEIEIGGKRGFARQSRLWGTGSP